MPEERASLEIAGQPPRLLALDRSRAADAPFAEDLLALAPVHGPHCAPASDRSCAVSRAARCGEIGTELAQFGRSGASGTRRIVDHEGGGLSPTLGWGCGTGHRPAEPRPERPVLRRPSGASAATGVGPGSQLGVVLELVLHDRLLHRAHLVEPLHGPVVRRLLQQLRALGGFARDREHRVAEGVERLLRLGLGRLDHQRLRRRSAGSRSSAGGSRSPSAASRRRAR